MAADVVQNVKANQYFINKNKCRGFLNPQKAEMKRMMKNRQNEMHMWYWLGSDLGSFLFQGYNITTPGGLLATCFGLAALAILYEGMKIAQIKLRHFTMASLPLDNSRNMENSFLLSRMYPRSFEPLSSCDCESWSKWLLEVFHWSFHTLLGYLLMLAIMTYNGYISIALALGSCLGYWIFGPSLIELNIAQLQAKGRFIKCTAHCAGQIENFSDAFINAEQRESIVTTVEDELEIITEANVEVHVPNDEIN